MKKRVYWIDNLRGLAMIFVVIGHMPINSTLKIYLYSFHVPLFFIISGISYGLSKNEVTIQEYLKKMFKRLIIPYFLLNLFLAPLWYLNSVVLAGYDISITSPILGTLYSNQLWKGMFSNVTWFLPALFIVSIIFKIIDYQFKRYRDKTIMVGGITLVGIILYLLNIKMVTPWHLQTCLIALSFYYLGYLYIKKQEFIDKWISSKIKPFMVIILFVVGYLLATKNGKISMHANNYSNIIVFYLGSIITSYAIIRLMKGTKEIKSLTFIGVNTLVYMAVHCPIMRFFNYGSSYSHEFLNNCPITSGIIIMILIIPLILLVNRFLPFIIGKKQLKVVKN
ncbi:MAG: acyltransferase family protein [Bacilli bacterium]|nr:acyltransferase family protein [Bacilli bacterium]MDD4808525.1 acyltransferase family protein [Bacilli bacterium]